MTNGSHLDPQPGEDPVTVIVSAQSLMEIREKSYRLKDLAVLLNHLRNLRIRFSECVQIAGRPKGERGELEQRDFNDLDRTWKVVRQNDLGELQASVNEASVRNDVEWFIRLEKQAIDISNKVAEFQMKQVVVSVSAFEEQLIDGERRLRNQLERAFSDLIVLCDRVLERLSS